MKKLITLTAAALLCGTAALQAKDADQIRVYLNPGHGSWCSNDRPNDILREVNGQLTVVHPGTLSNTEVNSPDTTAFYESNTNIRKVLAIVDKLESYGLKIDRTKNQNNPNKYRVGAALDLSNNIVMSHVMAGPFPHDPDNATICNRNLSEIREEVEVNNFDMFISLHSNAASGATTNYLSILYRGYSSLATRDNSGDKLGANDSQTTPDLAPGSIDMCLAAAPHALAMEHQHWTDRKTAAIGSGCIVADIDFYHGGSITENKGHYYRGYLGVLKHGVPGYLAEGYFHTYVPSRQRAMNWDADRIEGIAFARGVADYFGLQKEETGDVFGVIRDRYNQLEHSLYIAQKASTDLMLPLNGVTVTLYDENDVEVAKYVTDNHYNGAYVFQNVKPGNYTVKLEKEGYKMLNSEDYFVTVTAANTTYPENWMAESSYEEPEIIYNDYEDPLSTIGSVSVASSYEMKQDYLDKANNDIKGRNVLNRSIVRGAYIYTLAGDTDGNAANNDVIDHNSIIIISDVATGKAVRTVDLTDAGTVRDIALTADNQLLAITSQGLYRWKNDPVGLPAGLPRALTENGQFSDQCSLTFSGPMANGKAYMLNGQVLNVAEIVDGKIAKTHAEDMSDVIELAAPAPALQVSPLRDNALVVTSQGNAGPKEIVISNTEGGKPQVVAALKANDLFKGTGWGTSFFKMAGSTFMVVPTADAINLFNISDGLDKARLVKTTNTGVASKRAHGQCYAIFDARSGAYKGYYFDLYAYGPTGALNRITTQNVEQPKFRAHFAYDLKCTSDGNGMTQFTYKSTGAAPEGNLRIIDIANPTEYTTVAMGAVNAGDNTFAINNDILGDGQYTWAVEVVSDPIPEAGKVWGAFTGNAPNNSGKSTQPREGLVLFTNPNSPMYGKAVMSLGYNQGWWIYNPDGTLQGTYCAGAEGLDAGYHSSPFRGTIRGDKTVWADWSDAGAGYWEFDPMNPEAGVKDILAGTNDGTGAHIYNGKNIGGSASAIAFFGEGDDEVLWVAAQDTPTPKTSNNVIRYRSAGKSIIDMEPDQIWNSANPWADTPKMFSNANIELLPTERGIFITQIRSTNKNVEATPSFALFDYDGKVLLNSANIEGYVAGGSGIAISPDYSTLAASENSKGIAIIHLDWNNGVPTATKLYSMSTKGSEHYQMAFDPAGNLAVVSRGPGYELYTLRNDNPRAVTPAPADQIFAGVESILIDNEANDAPVEYFDLMGRRLTQPTPGTIVIRRQGSEVIKMIVK